MKGRLFSQRTLWIVIVMVFFLGTVRSVYEAIQEPSDANVTGAVCHTAIVAAMFYVARRDIREMDAER